MTDRDEHDVDQEVRALLSGARPDSPVPADVAARLDDVLAGLVAEREDAPTPVDLTAERERRRRRTWVGAAAAAVVLVAAGVVLPQVLGSGGGETTSADSRTAADEAGRTPGEDPVFTREDLAEEVGAYLLGEAGSRASLGATTDDATDLSDTSAATREADPQPASPSEELGGQRMLRGDRSTCVWDGAGEVREATYEGETVSLVLTEDARGRVVARIVRCEQGESAVVRTVTLPSDVPLP